MSKELKEALDAIAALPTTESQITSGKAESIDTNDHIPRFIFEGERYVRENHFHAHIEAWGKKQRKAGRVAESQAQRVYFNDAIEARNHWRERAEKAEAELAALKAPDLSITQLQEKGIHHPLELIEALDGLQELLHKASFEPDAGFSVRNCFGSFGLIRAEVRKLLDAPSVVHLKDLKPHELYDISCRQQHALKEYKKCVKRYEKALADARALCSTSNQELAKELQYATDIATFIWQNHYKHDAPNWKPLPYMMGVLSQIDDMKAGMCSKEASGEAWSEVKWQSCSSLAARPTDGREIHSGLSEPDMENLARSIHYPMQSTPDGANKTPLYVEDLIKILDNSRTYAVASYMGEAERVISHEGLLNALRAMKNESD